MKRFRLPFVYGTIFAAVITAAVAGGVALSLQGISALAVAMALGAATAVAVCSWWPGLTAPGWKLWPTGVLANPMFLLGVGYTIDRYQCFVGGATGWDCILADLGPFLCGLCLLPPLVGLCLRWWHRHRT
jgi:hypothetical protein